MKFKLAVAAMSLSLVAMIGAQSAPAKPMVTVYKSPTCGCCSMWVEHMQGSGFEVKAIDVDDIDLVKKTYGVPPALGSCHTALVNGYVIEGHVPAASVSRLIREKSALAGIAVPGMPVGSPGMEVGSRKDPFSVMSFDKAGKSAVYEKH